MSRSALPSLVVFDLAGTTIRDDGQVPAAFTAALGEQGIHLTDDQLTSVRGSSKKDAIRHFVPEGRVEDAYSSFTRALSRSYAEGGVSAVVGSEATFAWLRSKGVRIAFNTGFDRPITEMLLRALGWSSGTADALVCGDDVRQGRPAPDLIFRAMELTGVRDTARVANVGDTTLDLHAGHRAGVRFNIGVLSGAHRRDLLEKAPHTHLLKDVGELPLLFEEP